MVGSPTLLVRLMADVKDFNKGVGEVDQSSRSLKDKMLDVGKAIGIAFTAKKVVDFAKESIAAARDLNANMSRTQTIFGEAGDAMIAWGAEASRTLRLSQTDALEAANTVGRLLVGSFGMSTDAAADMSQKVVELSRDLGIFARVPFDQALEASTKAMMGQTRGLKAMGVDISAAEVKQQAMTMGLYSGKGALDGTARAQATFALMMEKSGLAQGATERSAKSLKGQQEALEAEFQNTKAAIGNALLPALTNLMDMLMPVLIPAIEWATRAFENFGGPIMIVAGAILAGAAAIKAINIVQALWNIQLGISVGWIGLIIAVAVLLVAGIVYLATKTQFFQKLWETVWGAIKGVIDSVVSFIRDGFDKVVGVIKGVIDWVKNNWVTILAGLLTGPVGAAVAWIVQNFDTVKGAVKAVVDAVVGFFSGLPGRIVSALAALGSLILAPFKSGIDATHGLIDSLVGWFAGIPGRIASAFSGLASAISSPFKGAFNAIRDLWNSTLGKVSFEIPGWVPGLGGKGFSFPKMAHGGYVDRPTLALIGEAGPEYVIPADRVTPGRGAPAVNIEHLTVAETIDIDVFMRRVGMAIRAEAM